MILLLDNPQTENRRQKILHWAEQYVKTVSESKPALWKREQKLLDLRATVLQDKQLTIDQLEKLVRWKLNGRWLSTHVRNIRNNLEADVFKHTSEALRAKDIWRSIDYLKRLNGIRLITGSAILHLFHEDKFPIFDQHAMRAVDEDSEDTHLWKCYVVFCRGIAEENNVSMRTLDRALFHFGKMLKLNTPT